MKNHGIATPQRYYFMRIAMWGGGVVPIKGSIVHEYHYTSYIQAQQIARHSESVCGASFSPRY
jgi:hypothetical protein